MKVLPTVLGVCAATSLAASAHAPLPQEISFRPKAGTELAKTFELKLNLELDETEVQVFVDDQEQEQPAPEMSMTQNQSRTVAFTDKLVEVEDGSPRVIRRTYTALTSEMATEFEGPQGANSSEQEGESDLEGETVVFRWDAEDEEWKAEFAEDSSADEELLGLLDARADYAQFLPAGEVDEGDAWEVDVSDAFRELFFPGGRPTIRYDGASSEEASIFHRMLDDLEGEFSVTFTEVVSEEGVDLAVLTLSAEIEATMERAEDIEREGFEGTRSQETQIELELEGKMRWNLGDGHLADFRTECDLTVQDTNRVEQEHQGMSIRFVNRQVLGGTVEVSGDFE